MSSTNKTVNYELTQFLGSDVPSWLVDYNGDMAKIDTGMHENAVTAASASSAAASAISAVSALSNDVSTLSDSINHEGTGLAARVSDVEGDVNTIESLIGNGIPTTTDKTIIGAINELNSEISGVAIHGLQGKKIAILGDSLSVASTWAGTFKDMLNGIATVDIKSQGSTHMSWLHNTGISTILGSNDYDILIIALGVNDWRNDVPLGTFSQSPLDNNTFNNAIVNGYLDILNYYPAGKLPEIYYVTPFTTMVASPLNTFKYSVDVYRKAIASFAKITGCRFINGDCIPILSNALSVKAKSIYMDNDGLHFDPAYNPILAQFMLDKIVSGGDAAVSGTDGVLMDLSDSLDRTNVPTGSLKVLVDGESTRIFLRGEITDATALAGSIVKLGTLNSDVANLFVNNVGGGANNMDITVYSYGLGLNAGRMYMNVNDLMLATKFETGTTRAIFGGECSISSASTHMQHFGVNS